MRKSSVRGNGVIQHLSSKPVNPKRVVILGAGGFVGSALVRHLQKEQIPYLALSRHEIDLAADNIHEPLSQLLHEDDVLVHLAVTTPNSTMNLAAYIANLKISQNITAALKKKPCQHVVYFSTEAIYPNSVEDIDESILPSPSILYGSMHLAREIEIKQTLETLGIPLIIVRPTQIYGIETIHLPYGPSRMCKSAINSGKIQLFGRGEERRDFIAIEDVVNLLWLVLQHRSYGTINFATGNSISFAELAYEIVKKFHFPISMEYLPRRVDVWHRKFDISCIRKNFPKFQFSELSARLEQFVHLENRCVKEMDPK